MLAFLIGHVGDVELDVQLRVGEEFFGDDVANAGFAHEFAFDGFASDGAAIEPGELARILAIEENDGIGRRRGGSGGAWRDDAGLRSIVRGEERGGEEDSGDEE